MGSEMCIRDRLYVENKNKNRIKLISQLEVDNFLVFSIAEANSVNFRMLSKKRGRREFIKKINPLSANPEYTPHDTVVTSDSCNSGHSENYELFFDVLVKELKFPTKWYTKLCNLVDLFLINCESQIFNIFKNNDQKRLCYYYRNCQILRLFISL